MRAAEAEGGNRHSSAVTERFMGGGGTNFQMTCTKDSDGNPAATCQDLEHYGVSTQNDGLIFSYADYESKCCLCGRPYMAATSCSFCTPGKYSDVTHAVTNTSKCKACPGEDSTSLMGSTVAKDCSGYCGEGKEFDPATEQCLLCPTGKYKSLAGSHACSECAEYRAGTSTESAGAASKADCVCDEGYFGDTQNNLLNVTVNADGDCVACPVGKMKSFLGSRKTGASSVTDLEEDCLECPPGTSANSICRDVGGVCGLLTNSRECWSQDDLNLCCICGGGIRDYQPAGQSSCTPCEQGKYSEAAGSVDCVEKDDCWSVFHYADDCLPCTAGKYSDETASQGMWSSSLYT